MHSCLRNALGGGKNTSSHNQERPVWPGGIRGLILDLKMKYLPINKRMNLLRPYLHHMGNNVHLYDVVLQSERYLISVEDNVTCATGVRFVTHDASVSNNLRMKPCSQIDKVGSIVLRENCFIGAFTILMPNTSVGKNSIVAAGSVVTKHIPDNEVWGGTPARFITKVEDLIDKRIEESKELPWFVNGSKLNGNDLVVSRENFYFAE